MKEKGIDISSHRPKGLFDVKEELDYLITMGCEDTCPAIPAKKIIQWDIPDPQRQRGKKWPLQKKQKLKS